MNKNNFDSGDEEEGVNGLLIFIIIFSSLMAIDVPGCLASLVW